MAKRSRREFERLKARLSPAQVKAAYLIVEQELMPTSKRMSLTEIAKACGVSPGTLSGWRRNPDFVDFKNMIADDVLNDDRERVYRVLQKLIFGRQPSIKAIELYFKRFGLLNDKLTVEHAHDEALDAIDDIKERLARLGIDVNGVDEMMNETLNETKGDEDAAESADAAGDSEK